MELERRHLHMNRVNDAINHETKADALGRVELLKSFEEHLKSCIPPRKQELLPRQNKKKE